LFLLCSFNGRVIISYIIVVVNVAPLRSFFKYFFCVDISSNFQMLETHSGMNESQFHAIVILGRFLQY
jgi:hypothetical protein